MKNLFIIFVLIFISQTLRAHPVIYKDGWAINSSNMEEYSNNYVMYSFTNNLAVGADHWRFTRNGQSLEAGLAKVNHLLWRHNGEDSQSNIYIHGGAGAIDETFRSRGTHALYMVGAEIDWETRGLFTALKRYQFHSPNQLDLAATQWRVGFSPYYADFNSLQSWFMVQFMHIDEVQEKLMITPMLRFFYHNVLWEVGSSTRGQWMLNLMVHM